MDTNASELLAQSRLVRARFEDDRYSPAYVTNLYRVYNPHHANPEPFVRRALEQFPRGNCVLATLCLGAVIEGGEIVDGYYDHLPHTFLRVGPLIVDITADQFGEDDIYVGPLIEPWSAD
jgi:hypothetical protein